MKTFLLHHVPNNPNQDTWAVSFSLPYIATSYARAGDGLWYVKTWLTADQIKKRLAILFDDTNELRIHELGRQHASINDRLHWLDGRLENEEPVDMLQSPRVMWLALASAAQSLAFSRAVPAMASSSKSLRAA